MVSPDSLTFVAGGTSNVECAYITIMDDDIYEENQAFIVSISTNSAIAETVGLSSIRKIIQDTNGDQIPM